MSEGARKDDRNKLRFDLIPIRPLQELATVYTIGAAKYSDRNWEKGLQWGRVYAALQRHVTAWWNGERNDPVDNQHHLASVAWCAFALMEYENTHLELDDRPKKSFNNSIDLQKEFDAITCPTIDLRSSNFHNQYYEEIFDNEAKKSFPYREGENPGV